jgi:RNA polymerase sigma factor for flagellar operon FliA
MTDDETLIKEFSHTIYLYTRRYDKHLPRWYDYRDLYSAGAMGLLRARARFDARQGVRFRTFAEHWIRGAILDEVRRLQTTNRVNGERIKLGNRVAKAFRQRWMREPSHAELADGMGMTMEQFDALRLYARNIFAPYNVDTTYSVVDRRTQDPLADTIRKQQRAALHRTLKRLPTRERTVIRLYFFKDMPLQDVGQQLGTSLSRTSQLKRQALGRMRTMLPASMAV